MRDQRQGTDVNIKWAIVANDAPFNLEGKDVKVYLKNIYRKTEVKDFSVEGNKLLWTFYGKDQKHTGKYSLELVINEGAVGMATTDKCDFINLVDCSCKIANKTDDSNVEIDTIELTSTIEYGTQSVSIEVDSELSATSENPVQNKVITAKLTKLSEEVSGLSEKIENLPSAESDVFKAIFDTTTYEEIKAAYDSGKVVHCDYESSCYVLSRLNESAVYFETTMMTTNYVIYCNANTNKWSALNTSLEKSTNKVTSLSSASTDTQYPSAKAVYDFVNNTLGTIINGDY